MPLKPLPLPDPGSPDLSSPLAFLRWLQRSQRRGQVLSTCWALLEMGCRAALPLPLGQGVQAAVDGDAAGIWRAGAFALALSAVAAGGTVLLHRQAVWNWITAATQVRQLVARQASRLGAGLSRRIATGEIVAVGSGDVEKIGWYVELVARVRAAVLVWLGVSAVVLTVQPLLGLVVLLGVPVLAASVWPLLGPFEKRYAEQRALGGKATELAADTVAGLRVLRGIGGEELFLARYRAASQKVRAAAVRATRLSSLMQAQQVLLPGLFVVGVTWYGAHLAATGRIGIGTLVSVYGATAFLAAPLRILGEAAHAWSVARVSAGRATRVLALTRTSGTPDAALARPERADLHDPLTGLTARAGELTAVVCGDPDFAGELAERLGGHVPPAEGDAPAPEQHAVRLGGTSLDAVPLAEARAAVLVHDKEPVLLSGTLAELLDVPASGRIEPAEALAAARAEDVLDALVDGSPDCGGDPMRAVITERGRSLSGGQRQRLALARSLFADPPVLVLDEPTSAVDAHTESRIAAGLRRSRAGRTTVVLATSPLLLDQADRVLLVHQGRVTAAGTHRELLHREPLYRAVVTREEDPAPVAAVPASVREAV
ncbi:ABC transporter [Kitasatospora herbaricolor]|uniref:ABC transporter transmembrane domain-containing protein n=1 Tax=Kitasatospora herbaricolor TaxID=68217 RepID=UPI00174C40EE|nr:ABC transporter ATP-binding protein [Kitasatospora herbaricolor]MDQ0307348.1 ABC-type multidrug transport system fused ATPase/permease subunit [Kitasatospora herbaricolor]GGV30588.1 ABC transporter [Kitasatospora herbaricolor]